MSGLPSFNGTECENLAVCIDNAYCAGKYIHEKITVNKFCKVIRICFWYSGLPEERCLEPSMQDFCPKTCKVCEDTSSTTTETTPCAYVNCQHQGAFNYTTCTCTCKAYKIKVSTDLHVFKLKIDFAC